MVEHRDAGLVAQRRREGVDHGLCAAGGEGDLGDPDLRLFFPRDIARDIRHRTVSVIGDRDLIARPERKGAQDGDDPAGGVVDEDEVVA